MSLSEYARLAEKARTVPSRTSTLASLVAFAASKGYSFTAEDVKASDVAKPEGKQLTDKELDGVSGGILLIILDAFGIL